MSSPGKYLLEIVLRIPVKALLMLVHYRKILHVGVVSRDSAFAFYISLSTVPLCNISRIALYPGTKKVSSAREQGYFPLCMNISSTLTNIIMYKTTITELLLMTCSTVWMQVVIIVVIVWVLLLGVHYLDILLQLKLPPHVPNQNKLSVSCSWNVVW